MSLLATESFDTGSTNQSLFLFGNATSNSTGGLYNTGCVFFPGAASTFNSYGFKTFRSKTDSTTNYYLNISFWFKATVAPQQNYKIIYLEDARGSTGQQGVGIGFNTDGRPVLWRNRGNVTDITNAAWKYTVTPSICDNLWHFIEFNIYTPDNSAAYAYLWQDGRLITTYFGNLNSLFGGLTRWDQVVFTNLYGNNGCHYWIDDLTIWDQVGSTFIGFKGPTRIQTLRPVSDVSSVNTTSTGATNYGVVDEEYTIDTSDYVILSNTANTLFEMSNLVSGTTNAYGFITTAHINSGQGGSSNIRIGHKIDSTFSYSGAQTYFSLSYSPSQLVTESNFAAGGSILLDQNVNNLIVSVDRIP